MMAAHWSSIVTAPHYIGEDKSDMRSIKSGWYAIESDGKLFFWTFSQFRGMRHENQSADEVATGLN
jgi:hypothetical protein